MGERRNGKRRPTAVAIAVCTGLLLVVPATTASAVAAPGGHTRADTEATAGVTPGSVPPGQDPFYTAPADIASVAPGRIVATRPVDLNLIGLPLPVDAWQISYRTNDTAGHAELGVTTLAVPVTPWVGTGSRPAVSVEMPEDSDGSQCAPSYLLDSGSQTPDTSLTAQSVTFAASILAENWAVSIPDFEGSHGEFLAGPQEGHTVLDGIRAIKEFDTDGVGASDPWALYGYSGGANAAGWAAQLQPSYAPRVHLVGAAIGGTPADPTAVASYIDGGVFSGFEFGAAYGISEAYPSSGITGLLNAQGKADFATISNECESDILSSFAFRHLSGDTTVPDPLAVPSVAAALRKDTLGAHAPTTPIYDYHADTDEIVPVTQDNTLVSDWCREGATVQQVRDLLGEHVEEAVVRTPSVVAFLAARFAGDEPVDDC
jgi:hypothetical protein